MQLLTPTDRAFVLKQLELAPDEILADAMLAFNAVRDKIVKVRTLANPVTPVPREEAPAPAEAPAEVEVSRANVNPGAPMTSKMSVATKHVILRLLEDGIRPGEKYHEAMKLMWARNEVKFDGKDFYL